MAAALMVAFGSAVRASPTCPDRPIRIAFTDAGVPPFVNGSGSTFQSPDPGLIVLEAGRVFAQLGCATQFVRLPQRRLERELTQGEVDMGMGYGYTPDRALRWQFPMGADGTVSKRHALAHSPVQWLVKSSRQAELEARWQRGALSERLGVVPDSVAARFVTERGLKAATVEYPTRVLQLLDLDRFDAIAISVAVYAPQLQQQPLHYATLQPPLGQMHYFAPVSKVFFARHPALAQRAWDALCEEARHRSVLPGCTP